MRTKQHWTLQGLDRDRMRAFFCQLWKLAAAFGSPPDPGGPDDDQFWQSLVAAVGAIGQQCDADHDRLIARLLLALMEGLGDLQADRPGERSA